MEFRNRVALLEKVIDKGLSERMTLSRILNKEPCRYPEEAHFRQKEHLMQRPKEGAWLVHSGNSPERGCSGCRAGARGIMARNRARDGDGTGEAELTGECFLLVCMGTTWELHETLHFDSVGLTWESAFLTGAHRSLSPWKNGRDSAPGTLLSWLSDLTGHLHSVPFPGSTSSLEFTPGSVLGHRVLFTLT